MECERCPASTVGYDIFDYCVECSANLCSSCMLDGCCGVAPAVSGMTEDDEPAPTTGEPREDPPQ